MTPANHDRHIDFRQDFASVASIGLDQHRLRVLRPALASHIIPDAPRAIADEIVLVIAGQRLREFLIVDRTLAAGIDHQRIDTATQTG